MSGGRSCSCAERRRPVEVRRWRVTQLRSNRSAFNGYREQASAWSQVLCLTCQATWRTRAGYVDRLGRSELGR